MKRNIVKSRGVFAVRARKTRSIPWGMPHTNIKQDITEEKNERIRAASLKEHVSLTIPYGYHAQVRRIAQMYRMDMLFRRMVERLVEFTCIGGEWELPLSIEGLGSKPTAKMKKAIKQKHFWDFYSSRINRGVPNTIPGKDTIDQWIVRNLLLNGLAILDWKWGKITVDGVSYSVPVQMTVHNPLTVVLNRPSERFGEEETWLYLGPKTQRGKPIKENENTVAPSFSTNNKDNWLLLNPMGKKGKYGSFVVKYQYTPADNTATIAKGTSTVGQSLYPVPPYIGLLGSTIQRQALSASDISVLDSIIGAILLWSIGNDTKLRRANGDEELPNQPYPATKDDSGSIVEKSAIEEMSDIITEQLSGSSGGSGNESSMLFAPYYVDGKYIEPPAINALLSSEKYVQPFIEILNAFGIIITPITGTPPKLDDINRANLEQMIFNIQREVTRFWETFCLDIIDRNRQLALEPNWVWNPMNTMTDNYREQLAGLAKRGRLSPQSDMLIHGRDPNVEISKMKQHQIDGTKELLDESTPVTFVQQSVSGGGSTTPVSKETTNTESPLIGRPKKVEGE